MSSAAKHAMKRIPSIKFPQRHPKSSNTSSPSVKEFEFFKSSSSQPKASSSSGTSNYRYKSDVPAPPSNFAEGGKASLLPKRTPVSEKEIEAILLGGDF